jgi:hypothetical protein
VQRGVESRLTTAARERVRIEIKVGAQPFKLKETRVSDRKEQNLLEEVHEAVRAAVALGVNGAAAYAHT